MATERLVDLAVGRSWARRLDWNLPPPRNTVMLTSGGRCRSLQDFSDTRERAPSPDRLPHLDAYDCPAILLGSDTPTKLQTRAALQSLGFDVLYGASLLDADEEPVLVAMSGYLDNLENRRRFSKIQAQWPQAPAFIVCDAADAFTQLASHIS